MSVDEKYVLEQLENEDEISRLTVLDEFRDSAEAFEEHERWSVILKAVEDANWPVRESAIRLAARFLAPERLLDLVANHENSILRNSGIEALKLQGKLAVPDLLKALGHSDEDVVLFATQILGHLGDSSSADALIKLIDHENKNIAQAAMEGLGHLHESRATPYLLEKLKTDMWLQIGALEALGEIGDPRSVEPLLKYLEDDMLAPLAIEALKKVGDSRALEPLFEMFVADNRLPSRDEVVLAMVKVMQTEDSECASRCESLNKRFNSLLQRPELIDYMRDGLVNGEDTLVLAMMHLTAILRPEGLEPDVIKKLGSLEQRKRAREAVLLWGSSMVPELIHGLESNNDERVRECALCLGQLKAAQSRPSLQGLLQSSSASVKVGALQALSDLGLALEDSRRICPLLADTHLDVCEAAALALASQGGEGIKAAMGRLGEYGKTPRYRASLLKIIAEMDTPNEKEFVRDHLAHEDAHVRRYALQAVAKFPQSAADVISCFEDSSSDVQITAITLAGELRLDSSKKALLKRLDAGEEQLYFIVRTLGQIGGEGISERLIELYPFTTMKVQLEILEVLGKLASSVSEEFLIQVLVDGALEMRRTAVSSLGSFRNLNHRKLFESLLKDKDWFVRKTAAWSLGEAGAVESLLALERLECDTESLVARTARAACERLESMKS